MLISGVIVSAGAVAVLARRLQRAGERRLADDVGLALDADWVEFTLAAHEEKTILSVLRDCPDLLQPLRDALQSTARRRTIVPNLARPFDELRPRGTVGDSQIAFLSLP